MPTDKPVSLTDKEELLLERLHGSDDDTDEIIGLMQKISHGENVLTEDIEKIEAWRARSIQSSEEAIKWLTQNTKDNERDDTITNEQKKQMRINNSESIKRHVASNKLLRDTFATNINVATTKNSLLAPSDRSRKSQDEEQDAFIQKTRERRQIESILKKTGSDIARLSETEKNSLEAQVAKSEKKLEEINKRIEKYYETHPKKPAKVQTASTNPENAIATRLANSNKEKATPTAPKVSGFRSWLSRLSKNQVKEPIAIVSQKTNTNVSTERLQKLQTLKDSLKDEQGLSGGRRKQFDANRQNKLGGEPLLTGKAASMAVKGVSDKAVIKEAEKAAKKEKKGRKAP